MGSNNYIYCADVNYSSLCKDNKHLPYQLARFNHVSLDQIAPEAKLVAKRASRLARSVLTHIFNSNPGIESDYFVFVSRFGELTSIENNNECNASSEELSPTGFSYSVHNAIACLFSIASKNNSSTNSISVSSGLVKAGLLESFCYLMTNQNANSVFVVVYDGYMPRRYTSQYGGFPRDYVLSFLVKRCSDKKSDNDLISDINGLSSFEQEIDYLKSLAIF